MSRLSKIMVSIVIILSLLINIIVVHQFIGIRTKLANTNQLVTEQVERNIRHAMLFISDLKENKSPFSLRNLQGAVQELRLSYRHWVDLNEANIKTLNEGNDGLTGIEALRNLIVNHLTHQHALNNGVLQHYDIEMLDAVYDNLGKMLLIFGKIKEDSKRIDSNGWNLLQITEGFEEISRLYRHSKVPNHHPQYIGINKAIEIIRNTFPYYRDREMEYVSTPIIRDGVHYYSFSFKEGKDITHVLWIDATNGALRNYELRKTSRIRNVTKIEAIDIAREYLKTIYTGAVYEEIFSMEVERDQTIFSFRFTPLRKEKRIISDAITINVDATSGEVIRFTRDFSDTQIPVMGNIVPAEELMELEEFSNMEYLGLAVIRTFETRYLPTLTHQFSRIENQQRLMLFFDAKTGQLINQLFYVHETIDIIN